MINTLPVTEKSTHTVLLYEIVYRSRFVWGAVLLLLLVFVLQPIEQAYADTTDVESGADEVVTDNTSSDVVEEEPDNPVESNKEEAEVLVPDTETEIDIEAETVTETIDQADNSDENAEVVNDSNETDNNDSVPLNAESNNASSSVELEADSSEVDVSTTTPNTATSTTNTDTEENATELDMVTVASTSAASTTNSADKDGSGSQSNAETGGSGGSAVAVSTSTPAEAVSTSTATTTDMATESPTASATSSLTSVATSTESLSPPTEIAASSTANLPAAIEDHKNELEFNENQCFEVGDGTFYCSKSKIESPVEVDINDGLLAAPDQDGDMEIYLTLGGEQVQITDNKYDDLAPSYDLESNTIVWHRLINDRYQIIRYDYQTKQEEQLTDGRFNNMEPSVSGEFITWQTWDGQDWEIVLFDGSRKETITNNAGPDIGPVINDGYVMWNGANPNGERQVLLYDLKTQKTEVIDDVDGGQVSNPRYILVYDAKYDNGDVVTRGYDPETGKVEPLVAQPGELPPELPPVDQTGETRALISNKNPNGREDSLEVSDGIDIESASSSTPHASSTVVANSSTTPPTDLVVEKIDLTASTTSISETVIDPTEIIEDVIIPPFQSTSSDKAG